MSLRSRLSFVLLFAFQIAFQIAIAAPSHSGYAQRNYHERIPTDGIEAISSLLPAQSRKANHDLEANGLLRAYVQQPGIILHGKDDREKQISLCEAGIVSACRYSIEAAQSEPEPDSLAATEKVHAETSDLALALNMPIPENQDGSNEIRLFPSAGFLVVSCAVVCVITVVRRFVPTIPSVQSKEKAQRA
ncbi:uncharacterized protein N7498_007048 [Penicillium cinerascens]|uniref:Transmembrane protein n=1 Tax=Penicillium cinerascens TaxID=70096 RepID=A0A9W9JKV5_9EURO|nr:uncharacterized protein N7498_007048 [Penicillium cinerascens]KAJ5197931.1 hypothetical protein N7498_007048 [Penicillium cinerascens]